MGVARLQVMVEVPGDVLDGERVSAGGVEALARFLDPDSSDQPTVMSSGDAYDPVEDGLGVHALAAVGAADAVAEVRALDLVQQVVEVLPSLVWVKLPLQCEKVAG